MKKYVLFLSSFFFLLGCYQDVDNSIDIIFEEEDDTIVNTSITGHLIDGVDQFVTGYSLEVGDQVFDIDNNYFLLDLEHVHKYGQHIDIKKDGALIARHNTTLIENSLNQLTIRTLPPSISINANSQNNLTNSLSTTLDLNIDKEALSTASNEKLDGDYLVSYRSIKEDLLINYLGRRAYNDSLRVVLNIEEILELGIYDNANNAISLGDQSTIQLNWKTIGNAANLAIYKYYPADARWRYFTAHNDGDILLNQSGIFCLASAQKGVYLEGELLKENKAISYQKMNLNSSTANYFTSSVKNGKYLALVAANTSYEIDFTDPCATVIESKTTSTSQEDKSAINFDLSATKFYNLGTSVFDCAGVLVPEVAIKISQNGTSKVHVFNDEEIDSWVSVCQDQFDISAYDIAMDEEGNTITWNTSYADNLSYLPICDQFPNGYTFLRVRDDYVLYEPFEFSFDGSRTNLIEPHGKMTLRINGNMQGSYPEADVNIYLDDIDFGSQGYFVSCQNSSQGCGIENCVITHYENTGGYIRVSFKGEIWMQTIAPPQAGNFPIEGVILCKT